MGRRVLIRIGAAVAVAASLALSTVSTASAAGSRPRRRRRPHRGRRRAAAVVAGSPRTPSCPRRFGWTRRSSRSSRRFRGDGRAGLPQLRAMAYTRCVSRSRPLQELRSRNIVGIHGAGPFWASLDGSRVTRDADAGARGCGEPEKIAPSGVDWLRVPVTSSPGPGRGMFSKVAFIQRIDTRGGLAAGQLLRQRAARRGRLQHELRVLGAEDVVTKPRSAARSCPGGQPRCGPPGTHSTSPAGFATRPG